MQCVICKQGEPHSGEATVTLERGGATVVIKGVPAMICENCGEYHLDEAMTEQVLSKGEQAVAQGAEEDSAAYAGSQVESGKRPDGRIS